MSYMWLHPRNGGCAIYKFVSDYEAELKAGYSEYPDGRDFADPPADPLKSLFVCDTCGKTFTHHLALAGHRRGCNG